MKINSIDEAKARIKNRLNELNIRWKMIPSEDYDDLILYPDNYSNDCVWFCLYRFYDIGNIEIFSEDKDGNFYGELTEDEFLTFVKNFKS